MKENSEQQIWGKKKEHDWGGAGGGGEEHKVT